MPPRLRVRREGTPPALQRVLDKLEDVTHSGGNQYRARCPAHDDDQPSLSVAWGDTNTVVADCKAGCTFHEVIDALGLTRKDLEVQRRRVANYEYEDEGGEKQYRVVRTEPKGFFQEHWDGRRWVKGMGDATPIPYHLPELAETVAHGTAGDTIWIVEGEKDVEAIEQAYGDVATCNHMGAGSWTDAHSEHFEGFVGRVAIVVDADDKPTKPGQKHALAVHESLLRVAGIEADLVYPARGKDAADHVGDYGQEDFVPITLEGLRAEIASAAEQPDDDRAAKVAEQAEYMRINREARALVSAEDWTPPPAQGSWADQLATPDEPVRWLISDLAFEGANVVVNAQAKSGKTSLVLNVAHALLGGEPLFGHFNVATLANGRSVAWWNAELAERQAKAWLRDFDLPRPEAFHPFHLRGYSMPFEVGQVEDYAVAWLSERGVAVWILDPLSALYLGDENSNTELGEWLRAIDRIKRRAGVETAFVVHHVSETAADEGESSNPGRLLKGRGASRLTGWADVLWSYSGRFNEPRYLSALGRDVDLEPFGGLHMDSSTRLLRFSGKRSTPTEDRRNDLAMQAYEAVAAHDGPIKAGELQALLPGAKPDPKRRAIAHAVQQGWLITEPGPRNAVLYTVGDVNPRRQRLRVRQESPGETDE